MEDLERPNPNELLGYVQKEELRQSQGKLKIYLGAAPGVGKTHTMLTSAIEKLKEGVDVVAGIIETHGRHEIESLIKQLEILPKNLILYREKQLPEFDLDAAIKRKPQLLLVDELAHSNAPGSIHPKRWQDIIELLDAGIDVYTTVNVQHIESLNNIVTQFVGIVVRETVPDTILEKAYAIELIDLPPEELIERLKEGKVYVSIDAVVAVDNFFRKDNLIALRELALRATVEQVDAKVLLHRRGESIEKIWPMMERLLVCVGPNVNSAKLIRTTFRIAKRLKAEWTAIHVETPSLQLSIEERSSVIRNLQLVEQLGGQSLTISGYSVPKSIVNFANDHHITRIILGKSIRSRWAEIFNSSVADELMRSSNAIDLHVLRADYQENTHNFKTCNKFKKCFFGLTANIYYTIVVVSIVSCLFVNFLLFEYLGLDPSWHDSHYIVIFSVILLVSQLIIYLSLRFKRQENFFRIREQSMTTMHLLNKQLIKTRGTNKLLELAIRHISNIFDSKVLILLPDLSSATYSNNKLTHKLITYPAIHANTNLTPKEQSVAMWVYGSGILAGLGTQTLPDNSAVYIPLLGSKGSLGVLRILPKDPSRLLIPEQLHLLEGFCNQIGMALEVDRLHGVES